MSRPFVVTVLVFSILVNFGAGVISDLLGGNVDASIRGGLMDTNQSYMDAFTSEFGGTIQATGDLEDKSDAFDRLLDKLHLGFIKKIQNVFNKYMFGFVDLFLRPLFEGAMTADDGSTALPDSIFFGLKSIITISYGLATIWLITGRKVW